MNNKMKKRTITGVAIISGAILVSVGVAGTMHFINENNAIEAKKYVVVGSTKFNASNQNITLNKDGGTGGADSLMLTGSSGSFEIRNSAGVAIKIEGKSGYDMKVTLPTKSEYEFAGYYYGNVKVITSDGYVSKSVTQDQLARLPEAGLVAKWNKVRIELDKAGGKDGTDYLIVKNSKLYDKDGKEISAVNANIGVDRTKVSIPTKTGYTFLGYYVDNIQVIKEDGLLGKNISESTIDTIKNVMTSDGLKAKWNPNIYEYTLDKQNGSGGDSSVYCEYENGYFKDSSCTASALISETNPISVPTREGYIFGGYYTEKEGKGTKVFDTNGMLTGNAAHWPENKTFYAQWTEDVHIYTIVYDGNGGSGAPNSQGKKYGEDITLSSQKPTREGYTFKEWNTAKDGTGVSYPAGGRYTDKSDYNGENIVTLYAQWQKNEEKSVYTITFDANGGTGAPSSITSEGGSITIPSNIPTKSGSQFWIWKIKGSDVSATPGGTFYSIQDYADSNGVITFVAQWGYQIKFDANGGSGAPSEMFYPEGDINIPSSVPTKSGSQFWIWKIKGSDVSAEAGGKFNNIQDYADSDGVVTFVAQWGYKIRFDANGGTGAPSEMFYPEGDINIPSSVPTKSGSQFWIWKIKGSDVSAEAGEKFYNIQDYADSDGVVTFVAQWNADKHTVTFNANGGNGGPTTQTKTYGASLELTKETPTREGYIFTGWNTNANGTGTSYQPGGYYSADEDVTLYAQWTEAIVNVESVSLDRTEATIKEGENLHLIATINPDTATNSEVRWESSNTEVATVKDGLVVAQSEGTTIITVTTVDGEKTATCKITVESSKVNVESVSLDRTEATIKEGGNVQLTATVTPDNATNKNVKWSSSNTAVATVDSTGYVTAKSEGTATITATTEDGNKTATATITVEKEITDDQGPTIVSIKGEKDSEGNYKVVIKATDESGIEKVLVNGAEITTKDSNGNFYFIPTKNGTYKIEVYDKAGNKTEQEYTEDNIIEKTKGTAEKDSDGNNIVYIETITNKKVTSVKVNGTEIKDKDSEGRYYFKPTQNGTYKVTVEYEDGTTEEVEYTENRFTNNNSGNNDSNSNTNGNNSGNSSTNNGSSSTNNSGTSTSSSNKGSGTLTSAKSTSGNTIGTSTALTNLPKTGTKMGALFAAIASGITAVFAWFKQRKEK